MPDSDNDNNYITLIENNNEKHIYFYATVDKVSAFNLCTQLQQLELINKYTPPEHKFKIILHLNCPGGLLNQAFIIADTIESLNTDLTCIVEGAAASAGVIILLSCKKSTMQKHSRLFVHETSHSTDLLSFNDVKDFVKQAIDINNEVKDYYVSHTSLTLKEVKKLLKEESIINYDDALKYNFITY